MDYGLRLILYLVKNREKEPPHILEVNSSPGTEGIEKASGQNISKEVIEFFMKESNRIKVPDACGFKEIVTINHLVK